MKEVYRDLVLILNTSLCPTYTLKTLISQKMVLYDKLKLVMQTIFLIVQENKAENVFKSLMNYI